MKGWDWVAVVFIALAMLAVIVLVTTAQGGYNRWQDAMIAAGGATLCENDAVRIVQYGKE